MMKELTIVEAQVVAGGGIIAAAVSLPFAPLLSVIGLGVGAANGLILGCQSYGKGEGLCQSTLNGVIHFAKGAYLGVALVKSAYNL